MQSEAENAYIPVVYQLQEVHSNKLNGGLISIETNTGKIKVVIGGLDFKKSQFNRAFQAKRQIGSSFKPILYAFGITKGFQLDSVFIDEPIEMMQPNGQVWTPKNSNDKFEGPMTLARALTYSNNIISIKLYLQLYQQQGWVQWIRKFGINTDVPPYPSSALGTIEITPEENCAAFNVFANNGNYVKPYLIEWVKDEHGNKIWEGEIEQRPAIDPKTASIMVNALSQRMIFNKQSVGNKNWINAETIGKSGSTIGAASAWFVGSTPSLTTAVYIGRDDNKPMGKAVFASKTAFPIWFNFNKHIKHEKQHFKLGADLKEVVINWHTGEQEFKTPYQDIDTIKILKS
jgi:penicillin-binding protein 1A